MAEPETRPTGASVDAFLDTLPEKQKADARVLTGLMEKATGAPGRQLDWFEVAR